MLSKIIYAFVSLLHWTYRYRYIGLENLTKTCGDSPSKGFILGIWHQNLFQGIMAQKGHKYVVIVSRSKDAAPAVYMFKKIGIIAYQGSSRTKEGVDKGGKQAMEQMIEELKKGTPGAVTIDGPKGPAREVKPGIIKMSLESGSPIVPYIPIPEKYWQFNSWDKFRLPKPFTRIAVYYGPPIYVDHSEGSFERASDELKKFLDEKEVDVIEKFNNWQDHTKINQW